jgi:CBS domain containing-hemolysin-like protein
MVTDEYGGFMGVVTLEDILREIVGDIADEFEQTESLIEKQPDGSYLVDAMLEVEEFAEAFGLPLPRGRVRDARRLPELPGWQHPRGWATGSRTMAGSSPSPRSRDPAWAASG